MMIYMFQCLEEVRKRLVFAPRLNITKKYMKRGKKRSSKKRGTLDVADK